MDTLGIDGHLDRPRIRHLFKIGIFAGLAALSADMVLGWGVTQEGIGGMDGYFSRYLTVSDGRIFASALLGMIGIPIECLSYFGVYRLMADRSPKHAHAYRAGILGMLIFSRPCGNTCRSHQQMIFNLLQIVAAKNLVFHQKIEVTSKRTTREKLMTYLMLQAKRSGSLEFEIPYDRQELADYLEVERSGLSVEIGKLRRQGVIEADHSRFKICRPFDA